MAEIILTEEQLRKIQRIEMGVLIELDRICRKHGIKYSLGYGTLLGAIRHKGFIPWDDDIDVCMLRADYEKFREICKTELSDKYFYQSNETDAEYFHLFNKIRVNGTIFKEDFLAEYNIHHGVYIDIFPFDYVPDNEILRKIQLFKLHFFRTGLMVKYMSLKSRVGKKRLAARILRILYTPFSLDSLYRMSHKVSQKYNDRKRSRIYDFCSSIVSRPLHSTSAMENIIEMPFEEYKFLISAEYDKLLSVKYGDYLQMPPENERVPKHGLEELSI